MTLPSRCLVLALLVSEAVVAGCSRPEPNVPKKVTAATSAPGRFLDVTKASGIQFRHNNGAFGRKWLPETMGSGVAFLDYDGDGYPDLFVVNGRGWTPGELHQGKADGQGKRPTDTTCHLYHNNRDGTFTDVTKGSGLEKPIYGMGVCVGDYDNDGRPDLYVTALGSNHLYRNLGNGKFEDVTDRAGVGSSGWSTSAAWVDYNRDGKLDLFVCHYVRWTPSTDLFHTLDGTHKSYARPDVYTGEYDQLFRNDGNGGFTDVSEEARIRKSHGKDLRAKSLGVIVCDVDGDGWPDLAVTNDTEPNFLFQNNRNGTFTERGTAAGIAFSETGAAKGAMGIAAADYDHSGRDSFLIGNFSNEMLSLYQNTGRGLFIDAAGPAAIGSPSLLSLTFGVLFLDYDNDGWQDILVANGHVDDDIGRVSRELTYAEKPLLFHNAGRGKFQNACSIGGPALATTMVARGMACADYDLDGSVDVAVTVNDGPLRLWHNAGGANHSIRLDLEGTKSNRSAIGAVARVTAGGQAQTLMVRSGGSYLSQSELPLTCGIGSASTADVVVHWPSGAETRLPGLKAGNLYYVVEGRGVTNTRSLTAYAPGR